MFGYIAAAVCTLWMLNRFLFGPILRYLLDPKGLKKYPSMTVFSGVTNIPYMLLSRTGNRSKELAVMHKDKPIIRVGPNSLSFGDCRAIKDIYGHNTKCIKDDMYDILSGSHFHLADVIDKAHHAKKRKVLSSAYAIKNLEHWEYKIADKIDRVVKHFDRCCLPTGSSTPISLDSQVDYRAWTNFFTMDAIADIGLSQSLGFTDAGNDETNCEELDGTIRQANYRDLHAQLTVQSHIVWSYSSYRMLATITKFSPYYNKMWKTGASYDGIVLHQARKRFQRYQRGEKLDDFFQSLMESKDGKIHNLEWGEIVAELSIMLNAGSVSTAIAINNVMYCLLKNPAAMANLRAEVDGVLSGEAVAPYSKVKHLPYLRACIDEAMRLYPPTPFNLPRKTPPEGMEIMGQFIPGNTTVSMSAYVAHRDTRVFPDPEAFRPDRWLGEEGKHLQAFFLTFSAGARGCLGRNISYLEQYMITATMVHRYDFTLPYPGWEQPRYEHFNDVPGPMPLTVQRRQARQ